MYQNCKIYFSLYFLVFNNIFILLHMLYPTTSSFYLLFTLFQYIILLFIYLFFYVNSRLEIMTNLVMLSSLIIDLILGNLWNWWKKLQNMFKTEIFFQETVLTVMKNYDNQQIVLPFVIFKKHYYRYLSLTLAECFQCIIIMHAKKYFVEIQEIIW